MKKLFVLLALLTAGITGFSQTKKKEVYLIIHLNSSSSYNELKDLHESFYTINAESESPYASDIYSLIDFKKAKKQKVTSNFYYQRNDTTSNYFNYFRNRTEALLFLSNKGWRLATIHNELNAGYSTMVYYLKKEID